MSAHTGAPVLIVGGGPVGLAAAIELARHDIGSVVVEARDEVSWLRPRAKTTSARTMEHFRRWGIAEAVRDRAPLPQSWSDAVVFCSTLLGREVTRFDHCLGLDLIHDELVAEGGQQIPQPLVELIMREKVETLPQVRLLTGYSVVSAEQDEQHVRARIRDRDGEVETLSGDYLIGCDGPHSMVRESIGARLRGRADERPNFNIVFRCPELAGRMRFGDAVHYWVLNPEQPGLVGRLDLVDRWWCVVMGVGAEEGAADPIRLVHNLIGDTTVPVDILATDPWRARMNLADTYRRGRIFLAGDAAHQNPPWGGHGFNTGIGDAVDLGWKLAGVLNGWCGENILDTYESERRPIAARTVDAATRNMATLGPELADPRLIGSDEEFAAAVASVAEATQRTKSAEFHSLGLVLGVSCAGSPIVVTEPDAVGAVADADYVPSAAPGGRLPHTWLSTDRSLYDLLGTEYSLVGEVNTPAGRAIVDSAAALGVPLTTVALDVDTAARLFEAPMVLVRPDQHVAWRGSAASDPADLLRRITGRDRGERPTPATIASTNYEPKVAM
ncbi:putative FAD-binding monooxygenase [Nocardia nova SH22a]|uniref:Putative FAD-binding monooxygenase n=2 Tax=Nocardia nova TaxID=37330 RepID=W5TKT4_9NOCA|nr:putative FAD-binding monooxygenase [Nocardia nova SH22a]